LAGGRSIIGNSSCVRGESALRLSSGYSQDSVMSNFKHYGFKGVLLKPYTVENFAQILREVVNG